MIVTGAGQAPRHDSAALTRPTRSAALPCPFCGGAPPLAAQLSGRFLVGCDSDDCHVNPQVSGQSLGEAWARWNKRQSALDKV